MIIIVNPKQIIVFVVNIDSPSIAQVNIGNMIRPAQDAINLADHADPVSATTNLQPYQNITEVGTPITTAESRALSFQYSENDWLFN
tara:strand:- start:2317 stop:2577 length:261 start_codon:yes stop_codon:yes gene_type:complete